MKSNQTESIVIRAILNKLGNRLGDEFTVKPSIYLSDEETEDFSDLFEDTIDDKSEDDNYIPIDLIITDKKSKRKFFIEIKGSTQDDDLPIAIVPSLRNLKKKIDFKQDNDNMVLVSLSDVSSNISKYLEEDDIHVIKVDQKEKYLEQLLAILKEK